MAVHSSYSPSGADGKEAKRVARSAIAGGRRCAEGAGGERATGTRTHTLGRGLFLLCCNWVSVSDDCDCESACTDCCGWVALVPASVVHSHAWQLRLAEERERRRREAQEAEWHEWEAKQAQLRAENARRHAETQAKLKEVRPTSNGYILDC